MHVLMVLALFSAFLFAGEPPGRTPDNDLVAELVAASNECLRDTVAPQEPDNERIWFWSCVQFAERLNDLTSDQVFQPYGSDVITAAIRANYAAATVALTAGRSETAQDALDLLDASDSLLAKYFQDDPVDRDDIFPGRPRDNALAKSALAATADCLGTTAVTWQTMMGPGAEWSIGRCDQLIDTMDTLLAEPGRIDALSPEMREAAVTLQSALEFRDDLQDPRIAGDVLLLTAKVKIQLNIWE